MDKDVDVQVGDIVKIYNANDKRQEVSVVDVSGNKFTVKDIDRNIFKDTIFVYGKRVNDFRTVDYEALSMLNISATQELSKQLQTEKEKKSKSTEKGRYLRARNKYIKKELAELKNIIQKLPKK